MARSLRIQYAGAFYHVTCRGNEQRPVFLSDDDREAFLLILQESLRIYRVILHAYVLMDNHFHLLVETPDGNLGEFMRRFSVSYTSYFNRMHRRTGHLFQGRYKALLVDKDGYLMQLTRYIHCNPVRTKKWDGKSPAEKLVFLRSYQWSSLPGFLDESKAIPWVTYDTTLGTSVSERKQARRQYGRELEREIRDGGERLTEKAAGGLILGEAPFVAWVRERFLQDKDGDREMPTLRALVRRKPDEIAEAIGRVVGEKTEDVFGKPGAGRMLAMEFLYQMGELNNREIGERMGIDYSTVSVSRRRLRDRMKKDGDLRRQYAEVEKELSKVKI